MRRIKNNTQQVKKKKQLKLEKGQEEIISTGGNALLGLYLTVLPAQIFRKTSKIVDLTQSVIRIYF